MRRRSTALDPGVYPDTSEFRELDRVLVSVRDEWPVLVQGTSFDNSSKASDGVHDDDEEEDAVVDLAASIWDDRFDAVRLALELLEEEQGEGARYEAFQLLKNELDAAVRATLDQPATSFRAYEAALASHHAAQQSLGACERETASARRAIMDARARLDSRGTKDALAGMSSRMEHLDEMSRLLDEIEYLRLVPDRLEALLAERRFLRAVQIVMRALKMINKPELLEVGAVHDIRHWLVLQEGVLLEMLIDELHAHLYLKNFYCDARWKAYTPGQTERASAVRALYTRHNH